MIIIVIYVVKQGDSLYSICKKYNVNYLKVAEQNEIPLNETLVIGQTIVLKDAEPQEKKGSILVNGYAYPSISDNTLEKTLPYLSYLSLFSYKVRADGSIDQIPDEKALGLTAGSGVKPAMVIANIAEAGGFSSELASSILNDSAASDNLLKNVSEEMKEKGYSVLDVDFEYIFPKDKEAYNAFINKAADYMHSLGYSISTALAPKTSTDQKGVLYEAHDYAFHGKTVDHVILMTYEWGYTYSSPMAVAPLDQVTAVIDYALTQMPADKILMGIPNYGYDWVLPYTKGTAAKTVGNYQAVDIARKYNTEIMYDVRAQSPYFGYYDEDKKQHVVWFEDARSINAKLELIARKKLAGASYWTINRFFPQNWLVVDSLFNIDK